MTPGELDLGIVRGLTFSVQLTMTDTNDDPVDLTGWSVWAEAKETTNCYIFDLSPVIDDAVNGVTVIQITDEATALLKLGTYTYDLIFENSTGARLGIFLTGTLTITDPITKP